MADTVDSRMVKEAIPAPSPVYDLHIRVPKEMQTVLKEAAQLAYKMGDVPSPELVDLMNLYIGWGLAVQKKKWLDRVGYR